jgi:hypothetical protein
VERSYVRKAHGAWSTVHGAWSKGRRANPANRKW